MTIEGMDPEVVVDIAMKLKHQSQQIGAIVSNVDGLVSHLESSWNGDDAAHFADWWHQQHRPALLASQEAVEGLHSSAIHNVEQQFNASGEMGETGVLAAFMTSGLTLKDGIFSVAGSLGDAAKAGVDDGLKDLTAAGKDAKAPNWTKVVEDPKFRLASKGVGGALVIVGGALAGWSYWNHDTSDSRGIRLEKSSIVAGATMAGAYGGAIAGAAIGSAVLPPLGTVVGGAVGGAIGGWVGESLGKLADNYVPQINSEVSTINGAIDSHVTSALHSVESWF